MTDQSRDPDRSTMTRAGRNRRFVISIWLKMTPDGAPLVDGLYGNIWEADAAAPGQLADPIEFRQLSAVEGLLDGLIRGDRSAPAGDA